MKRQEQRSMIYLTKIHKLDFEILSNIHDKLGMFNRFNISNKLKIFSFEKHV
jgi:hypothetical protein